MKNYRIVRLVGLHYQVTVQSFLDQHPYFFEKSYEDQLQCLFKESPVFSDAFSRSFRKIGKEAIELVIDFEVLQKKWAKENGIAYSVDNWMFDIMIAQIEILRPDVVYIQSHTFNIPGIFFKNRRDRNLAEIIREKFPFIHLVCMFVGYPCTTNRIKGVDLLFADVPSLVTLFKKKGHTPSLLYHAFDESIIPKLQNRHKEYEFTFAGSSRSPETRYWALRQLMEETNLEMWLYEHPQPDRSTLKYRLRNLLKKNIGIIINPSLLENYEYSEFLPRRLRTIMVEIVNEAYYKASVHINKSPMDYLCKIFRDRCNPPVMGLDMYNILQQSMITFNKHTDTAKGDVGNMRMFEATGVGTCLLTDTGNNMNDLFDADNDVVTYSTIDEAVEKVKYLIEHQDVAAEIASAGQKRTLKDHTILSRCHQIDEVIQKNL